MPVELLQCPFCGGDVVLDCKSDSARGRCLACNAEGSPRFFDGDDQAGIDVAEAAAAEAWNTRYFGVAKNLSSESFESVRRPATPDDS